MQQGDGAVSEVGRAELFAHHVFGLKGTAR